MKAAELRLLLRESAKEYATAHGLPVDSSYASALIFKEAASNFCPASYEAIQRNPDWLNRTTKPHSKVAGVAEMQSSNSSDALLMSVFCHPRISAWKGAADLLGFVPGIPVFGFKPLVAKQGTNGDETEIDLLLDDCFIEAKLTEQDFTDKKVADVVKYTAFTKHFHTDNLPVSNGCFQNYQLIRNFLAAIQHGKSHILLCDERRADLVRSYLETVSCLRDSDHRKKCRVIFWQDIQRVCGADLALFLDSKYGIR